LFKYLEGVILSVKDGKITMSINDTQKTKNHHFKRNIAVMSIALVMCVFIVNASIPQTVTLAFTSSWTSEGIYQVAIYIQNPTTYAVTIYYLVPANYSCGLTVPVNSILYRVWEWSNLSASRFTSGFPPNTDSFANFTVTNPVSISSSSIQMPYQCIGYNGSDVQVSTSGYDSSATYYYTDCSISPYTTLTAGTWSITIVTYTQ
jgi:hypothetical protein